MRDSRHRNCVANTRLSALAPQATPDDGLPHTGRPSLSNAQGPCTYSRRHLFFHHVGGCCLACGITVQLVVHFHALHLECPHFVKEAFACCTLGYPSAASCGVLDVFLDVIDFWHADLSSLLTGVGAVRWHSLTVFG